jgi:hypothetical protein
MNLTRLKTYAPAARAALITAVTRRAAVLGIQPGRVEEVTESGGVALIGGQPFPRSIVPLRKQLLDLIHRDGFDHTMEAMAYTWFNRLVALRFMELHDGYLDHGYRVLSHPQGTPLPEILQHAEHVSLKGLDREEVIRLKLDGNRDEELYRLLLLAQCAELNHILPDVFSKLDDATILLLPDNLLHSDSVIRQLVAGSDAEDWQQVEVLGWLYQFYISEKKDAVMARKSAVPTEDIPAVTQLFTPHWIVRYLVENSLGRLWLLNRPGSRLREHMPYYIEGAAETDFLKINKPEEIKLLDPASGSGHMLTYAFDLLVHIYEEEGYAANDIPGLILKHNLHGTEICPRAAQLAELALVFKARGKSRRFFQPEHLVRPNIIELQNVRFEEGELSGYFKALGLQPSALHPQLNKLMQQFEEAKNFGALIQPCLSEADVQSIRSAIQNSTSIIQNYDLMVAATHLKFLRVIDQAEVLTQRYHVVAANPPYMGGGGMNNRLKTFVADHFPDAKSDLFSCFIERSYDFAIAMGYSSMVTMQSWMFLSSYLEMRERLLRITSIVTMAHLGPGGFDHASAMVVQTTAFVLKISVPMKGHKPVFYRLMEIGEEAKRSALIKMEHRYSTIAQDELIKIPGSPLAYFASPQVISSFIEQRSLESYGLVRQGAATSDNERFLRLWHEVSQVTVGYGLTDIEEAKRSGFKWFPYNKGGSFKKWYGNHDFLINYENDGKELKDFQSTLSQGWTVRLKSREYYFKESVSWPKIASFGTFAARYYPAGFIFDVAGCCFFPTNMGSQKSVVAFLNSNVAEVFLKILSPTVNFEIEHVKRVPFIPLSDNKLSFLENVFAIAKDDWNAFERSWDFRDQPLLRPELKGDTLEASWRNWEARSSAAICQMQELETENNQLFITAYGLEGELEPQVPMEQITLARADAKKDIAAFLSYGVGCMMGRFSLDAEGLILANAGDSLREFLEKVEKPLGELIFAPDVDGIVPVLDGEWFEDDIVARAKEFLRATFGEATLNENLRFIEESLGRDLRDYFLTDFYKDHLQTYKNRPIYWLFSSGKQKAFQCLVYLHRYTPGTLARIRTEYAIPLQGKLSARITRLEEEVTQTSSSAARKKLQTELDKCKKQMVELLAFDEQLRSYADQAITLDLDDGVKTNYAKFGPLVAEAKKIYGTKDD